MTRYPRILLQSDLHLDTGPFSLATPESAAIAVFAGDTHHGPVGMPFLRALTNLPVVAVAGNHDFWGGDYFEALARLKAEAADAGVNFLENSLAVVDGVRFLGATLWTDYAGGHPVLMHYGLWRMNDHRHIRAEAWWSTANKARFLKVFGQHALEHFEGCFNPLLARELHLKTVRWLKSALNKPFDGPTVVVTHHAPAVTSLLQSGVISETSLQKEHWSIRRSDDLHLTRLGSYASDVLPQLRYELRAAKVAMWAHGHIHHALDYAQSGVRVVANPRGRVRPPLTAESAQAMALFGYRISAADIEASQRSHAENPEEGDGAGHDRMRLIDLDDSLYPCIAAHHRRTMQTLEDLLREAKMLLPLARSRRQSVADLAGHRVDTLKAQAVAATQAFADDMANQLVPFPTRLPGLYYALNQCHLTTNQRLQSVENIAGYDWLVSSRERSAEDPSRDALFGADSQRTITYVKRRIDELKEMLLCVSRAEMACYSLRENAFPAIPKRRKKTVANSPEW